MKVVLGIGCFVAGWLLASMAHVALLIAGLDVPARVAPTLDDYRTYTGVEILILTILFSVALYRVIGRRVFHWPRDERPFLDRLPAWTRRPTPIGLVVAWVVAVFTVVVYPLAIYMSWRYYKQWRAGQRTCPRCAENVKAAALVCRYCGENLDPIPPVPVLVADVEDAAPALPSPAPPATAEIAPTMPSTALGATRPSRRIGYVIGGLAAVAVLGYLALAYVGSQTIGTSREASGPSDPECVIVADGPLGRMAAVIPDATTAQCEAELASARQSFGVDSATSYIFISHVVPAGTPDCTVGLARVYTFGLAADELRSRICQ